MSAFIRHKEMKMKRRKFSRVEAKLLFSISVSSDERDGTRMQAFLFGFLVFFWRCTVEKCISIPSIVLSRAF